MNRGSSFQHSNLDKLVSDRVYFLCCNAQQKDAKFSSTTSNTELLTVQFQGSRQLGGESSWRGWLQRLG
jgi:hypothetical protein